MFSAALLELKRLLCESGPACGSTRHTEGMLHSAFALRQQTAAWIYHHADCSFGDIPLREWIGHETGETVSQYCSRMRLPSEWGGVIELFAISRIFGVGVGPDVKQSKIEKWVSLPVSEHDFPVSDWGSLQAILKKLIAAACPPTPPPM